MNAVSITSNLNRRGKRRMAPFHPTTTPQKLCTQVSGQKSNADAIFGLPKPTCRALHVQANHNYSASYFDLLRNHLRPPSKVKHCGLLSTTIYLQHGNIRPCIAETFFDIHLGAPPSSSYPPELVFSDCHIFEPHKEALGGQTSGSDKELQEAVHKWLCMWPKKFFRKDSTH